MKRNGTSSINGNLSSDRGSLTTLKGWRQRVGYYSAFAALPAVLVSNPGDAMADRNEKPKALAMPIAGFADSSRKSCGKPELLQRQSEYRLPHRRDSFDMLPLLVGNDDCPGRSIPAGNYTSAAPYIDSGNNVGANDTVSALCIPYYCYTFDSAFGPDHLYTFKMTSLGSNPQIQVSANSSAYKPLIYVVDSRFGSNCPSGTGNSVQHWQQLARAHAPAPGGTATIDLGALPLNTNLYLFVDAESGSTNAAGPYTVRIQNVTIDGPAAPVRRPFDFDGDGKADISVFRPGDRTWYLDRSAEGFSATPFGLSADRIVPADYDGDGKTDIAVYRDGSWWRLDSSNGTVSVMRFGVANDIPVPADYSGDGAAELAVYRAGTWFIFDLALQQSSAYHFGVSTDKPVVADYDGDGRADHAVFRNGEWHLNRSSQGYAVINFGLSTDLPVVGDYDGDGRTDQAIYRNGEWHLNRSMLGYAVINFGLGIDIPTPADYDGDGRTDAAIYREGAWYLLQSTSGLEVRQFGLSADSPVPASYVPQ